MHIHAILICKIQIIHVHPRKFKQYNSTINAIGINVKNKCPLPITFICIFFATDLCSFLYINGVILYVPWNNLMFSLISWTFFLTVYIDLSASFLVL